MLGNFNLGLSCNESNVLSTVMSKFGITQLVNDPSHTQDGIIDHCYISKVILPNDVKLFQKAVYYTDHDFLDVQCNKTRNMI